MLATTRRRNHSSALCEPSPFAQIMEDDEIAAAGRDDLPVAAPDWPTVPPAVFHEPRLAHGIDKTALDRAWSAVDCISLDPRSARLRQPVIAAHSNGVSTTRRSGTRDSASTASTRSAASGPAAARA